MKTLILSVILISLTLNAFVTSSKSDNPNNQQSQELSQDEIEQMIASAEEITRTEEMDRDLAGRFRARNKLESFAYWLTNQIEKNNKLNKEDKEAVYNAAMDTIQWIEVNLHSSLEEYQSRKAQLEEIAQPILAKMKVNSYERDEF